MLYRKPPVVQQHDTYVTSTSPDGGFMHLSMKSETTLFKTVSPVPPDRCGR